MKTNAPIQIERVANGFIVTPETKSYEATPRDDLHVFHTLEGLHLWLQQHFPEKPE